MATGDSDHELCSTVDTMTGYCNWRIGVNKRVDHDPEARIEVQTIVHRCTGATVKMLFRNPQLLSEIDRIEIVTVALLIKAG